VRADIVPGAVFPDYELTDQDKARRSLSDRGSGLAIARTYLRPSPLCSIRAIARLTVAGWTPSWVAISRSR
jgi:hypothetical protein